MASRKPSIKMEVNVAEFNEITAANHTLVNTPNNVMETLIANCSLVMLALFVVVVGAHRSVNQNVNKVFYFHRFLHFTLYTDKVPIFPQELGKKLDTWRLLKRQLTVLAALMVLYLFTTDQVGIINKNLKSFNHNLTHFPLFLKGFYKSVYQQFLYQLLFLTWVIFSYSLVEPNNFFTHPHPGTQVPLPLYHFSFSRGRYTMGHLYLQILAQWFSQYNLEFRYLCMVPPDKSNQFSSLNNYMELQCNLCILKRSTGSLTICLDSQLPSVALSSFSTTTSCLVAA